MNHILRSTISVKLNPFYCHAFEDGPKGQASKCCWSRYRNLRPPEYKVRGVRCCKYCSLMAKWILARVLVTIDGVPVGSWIY
jgi:hypothetical protein